MIRWLIAGAVAIVVALLIFNYGDSAYVWLLSEATLDRRYTLPRSLVVADSTPVGVQRGARLVRVAGCTGCHGPNLRGRMLREPVSIRASNLRALISSYSDEDFDRAIRRGLRPDASSLWVMPSQAYVYIRDTDIAAILGYLRALKAEGRITPPPQFGSPAREKIARGALQPAADLALTQMPAIDLGPHYSGGRYIAMFACGVCHGTELNGSPDGSVPDLKAIKRYTRTQFFNLLREGWSANHRRLETMAPLARQRFHILMDWEIDPLYAYLLARSKAPTMDQISSAIR
ncbi:MAG TPA: c-type cytochrome [Rhizomicrobium sp.]|jgi:cytochrome c553|nr:c-type cytochrome [Rhizomicrobium sp.]